MKATFEPVHRARARVQLEGPERAAGDYLKAGEQLLARGNIFAAAAVFEEGLRAIAHTEMDAEKSALSKGVDDAVQPVSRNRGLSPEQHVQAVFEYASRFWGETERPFHGHEALCFRCQGSKPAAWVGCSLCGAYYTGAPEAEALDLLLSERVCSLERLNRLATPEHRQFAREASRYFARALAPPPPPAVLATEHDVVPGLLMCWATERAAVLLELLTGADLVAEKPDVVTFAEDLCACLCDGRDDHEQQLKLPGLRRRFGTNIEIGRIERLSVVRGATAASVLHASSALRPVRVSNNPGSPALQVVAAVALSVAAPAQQSLAVGELAGMLAQQLVGIEQESRRTLDDAQQNLNGILLEAPFARDPSITVADAIAVIGNAQDMKLSLSSAARLRRSTFDDGEPEDFPRRQALRA